MNPPIQPTAEQREAASEAVKEMMRTSGMKFCRGCVGSGIKDVLVNLVLSREKEAYDNGHKEGYIQSMVDREG